MKKKFIMMLLLLPFLFSYVKADEYPDVTGDVEIRYKWYKEVMEGDYYPLKEVKEGYITNEFDIKYGEYSLWTKENCDLSNEYYLKDYKTINIYKKLWDVRFIKLDNFQFDNNIRIYHNNKLLNYEILYSDDNITKIDLKQSYRSENLIFFIENSQNYKISLYMNKEFTNYIISKEVIDESVLIPDKTWITKETIYNTSYTEDIYEDNDLTFKIDEYNVCRYREKYVYKYQIKKEYYDDNYYNEIDNDEYIKDINDYKVFYKGNPITNNVEIIKEKIIKEPQIEYIEIIDENNIEKNDSSKEIQEISCLPKIKTEVEEKKIYLVPKKIYLVIILLIIVIIFLGVKLFKKCVD